MNRNNIIDYLRKEIKTFDKRNKIYYTTYIDYSEDSIENIICFLKEDIEYFEKSYDSSFSTEDKDYCRKRLAICNYMLYTINNLIPM